MGKSTPSAPATPNPVATASAQGTSNANTAAAQTALNNANVVGPYGSTSYQVTGSQSITNPDGTTTSVPTYTQTQSLSAPQQQILDQNNALSIGTNRIAGQALNGIGSTLASPIAQSQLSPLTLSAGATPSLATGYASGGAIQSSVPVQMASTTFAGSDPSSFTADRDAATNAALARLQPQMDRDNAGLQAQLANQGVTAGSSAYTGAMQGQAQANNDLRLGAVQTGDAEQQALYGEAANTAAYGLSATTANNAASLAAGQFANSAQSQAEQESAARASFGNTAATQDYQNRLAGGAFANQAAAQQLSQRMALQNQQINEISALRSGGQVTGMAAPSYAAGTLDQTPISSDTYATAGLQNQQYMAQLQQSAANTAALGQTVGSLATAAGGRQGFKSDRRLKSEVARIATARNGLPIYRYRLAGADGWHLGMMADEVALLRPDAVWTDPDDGWARVDYEKAVASWRTPTAPASCRTVPASRRACAPG